MSELEPIRSNGLPSPDLFPGLAYDAEYRHLKEYIRKLKKAPTGSDPRAIDKTWEIYKKVRDECLQLCKSLLAREWICSTSVERLLTLAQKTMAGTFPSNRHLTRLTPDHLTVAR